MRGEVWYVFLLFLGTKGAALVTSPDAVSDSLDAARFAERARVKQRLDYDSSRTTAFLACNRPPQEFDTPEAAVESLVAAAERYDVPASRCSR
jgi:hypothetical protein